MSNTPATTTVIPVGKPINGSNIIVKIANRKTYHATSHSLTLTPNILEYKTKDVKGTQFTIGDLNWSISVSGLASTGSSPATATSGYTATGVIDLVIAGALVDVVVELPNDEGGVSLYAAKGVISEVNIEAAADENSTYSMSLKGSDLKLQTPA